MSYFVRASSRCASSSLPSPRSCITCMSSSSRIDCDRRLHAVFGHDVVDGRVDEDLVLALEQLAGERVDRVDVGDLVAEELDAVGELLVATGAARRRRRGRGRCRA